MIKALLLDSGSTIKLKYTSDAPHLIYLRDISGSGYYNCGYGCQWYDYDPGCLPCSPLNITKVILTSSEAQFSGAISNGKIFEWGYNDTGQLGDNSLTNRCTPISIGGNNKTFCAISSGRRNILGLEKNGQLWGWGYNLFGQLGNNTTNNKCTPVSILGAKKTFVAIAAGYSNTGSIDKNGQVWCWGNNNNGQLGNNTTDDKCTPISIQGVKKTFCVITVGLATTASIDKNGQMWCWGYNIYGQLGNNSTVSRCTPISILGAKKTFCQVKSVTSNFISLDKNGQIWGWGRNDYGQLGDNSIQDKCTPVSIQGTKRTFCKIDAGSTHTLAIDKTGRIWTWGSNTYGELGNNSTTLKCTPVSILGSNKTFCNIAGGYYYSLAIDKNGHVWGWGYNKYGQLGDNSVICRLTPIRVCNF